MKHLDRCLAIVLLLLGVAAWPCRAQSPVPPSGSSDTSPPAAQLGAPKDPPTTPAPSVMPLPPPRQVPPSEAKSAGQPVELKPPQLEASDLALPINLAAALRLADARPLMVAAAQASLWVAEAQLQRARLIWVPTLNLGFDYTRHDGFGPDFNRGLNTALRPLNNNTNFLYSGGGFTAGYAAADAIFEPLAAKQVVKAKQADIQAAKNDVLLHTAEAYFSVHEYRGRYAGALDVVDRGQKLVERIEELSRDLVPKVEVDRAINGLADLEQQAASAREAWRVQSAKLTLVLRLDPRAVVVPIEHDHLQVTLIDPARTLDDLIPIGLLNRPELASQQAMVQAVVARIRREKGRLYLPTMMLNGFQTPYEYLQFGAQGIGSDRSMNLWSFRDDFSPQILWQYEAMGLGNLARIREQRGEESKALVEMFRIQDGVAADVVRNQAHLQSAAVRVLQADRALREAIITYNGNYEGLRQTKRFGNLLVQVYRPQEAVAALEHLKMAYDQYFATVAEYNRAQFRMFHALGYPAEEVAKLHPPGDPVPVDTERPGYLPHVGVGPPPATR